MKIPFNEITMLEIEQLHKDLLSSVEKKELDMLELDFTDVSKMGLCAIQLLISLKKYCDEFNIELKYTNINASQIKNAIETYSLDETIGI